jgi:hypothetical protein
MQSEMNLKNTWFTKKILRLLLLVFFTVIYSVNAFALKADIQTTLNSKISIEFKNVSLKEAVIELGRRLPNISFTYIENDALNTARVKLLANNEKVGDLLTRMLSPFFFSYAVLDDHIIIRFDAENFAKQRASSLTGGPERDGGRNIKGIVANAQMAPVAGVAIIIKNKGKCGTANLQGMFNLHHISDSAVLIFSKAGYRPQQVRVVNATGGFLVVQLAQDKQ